MDAELFEKLLCRGESESLDFKVDQYSFSGATHDEQAELLKDVLAFANSWRDCDAYILIGVQEVRGGVAKPLGIKKHLEDHELQQFVNTKTQRPVSFRYESFTWNGLICGIIKLPAQQRPLYLLRPFGRLTESTVYIRRGSSTDVAKPDEVAKMGTNSVRLKPEFEAYIEPKLKSQHQYQSLEIATWLFNQGTATADDVVVIVQRYPVGNLGLNYNSWKSYNSAYPGTALALNAPLNPGGRVFLFSVNLGVPNVQGGREDVVFALKVLARDHAPVDLGVSYSPTELEALTRKKYAGLR